MCLYITINPSLREQACRSPEVSQGSTGLPAARAGAPGSGYHVQVPLTFLNMTSEMTAEAVNRAAMIIIMIPTGMFLLSPVREEIQPLWNRKMRLGK